MSHIIIGHTTDSTSCIWVKTNGGGNYWLVLTSQPIGHRLNAIANHEVDVYLASLGIESVYSQKKQLRLENGYTNTFDIRNLQPATVYYYSLIASAELEELQGSARLIEGGDDKHRFKSMPLNPSKFSFGFYSCNDLEKIGINLWKEFYQQISEKDAAFVIGGGDQMYADSSGAKYNVWKYLKINKQRILNSGLFTDNEGNLVPEKVIEELAPQYRKFYEVYWNDQELQKVFSQFPQYMIWDDHEIMDGWGSFTAKARGKLLNDLLDNDDSKLNIQLSYITFLTALKVYNEFQHSHNPQLITNNNLLNPQDCVWDYHFNFGNSAFYFLDMRGHHDVELPDGERLLGSPQKIRFQNWINSPSAANKKVLFLISPVPVVHWKDGFASTFDFTVGNLNLAKDDFRDEWGHAKNRTERNWLLNLVMELSQSRNQKIVFLSGDVHSFSLFKITNEAQYPGANVYNLTSSGISRKPAPLITQPQICNNKDKIKGLTGARLVKFAGQAGRNNFACISVNEEHGEVKIKTELFYYKNGTEQLKSIITYI